MRFASKIIAGAGILVAVGIAVFLLSGSGETAELERVLRELEQCVRKGDVEATLRHVDPAYDHGGETYADVDARARRVLDREEFRGMTFEEIEIDVEGEAGSAKFTAVAEGEFAGRWVREPARVALMFRKTAGGWKITGYEVKSLR